MVSQSIVIILGVVLFSGCNYSSPNIISKPDEKNVNLNFDFLQMDPDIAEDAKLTTVSVEAISKKNTL